MSAALRPLTTVSLETKLSVVPGRNFSGQMMVGEVGAVVMMAVLLLICECDGESRCDDDGES